MDNDIDIEEMVEEFQHSAYDIINSDSSIEGKRKELIDLLVDRTIKSAGKNNEYFTFNREQFTTLIRQLIEFGIDMELFMKNMVNKDG